MIVKVLLNIAFPLGDRKSFAQHCVSPEIMNIWDTCGSRPRSADRDRRIRAPYPTVPVKRETTVFSNTCKDTPQFFDENGEPAPFRLGVSYVYIDDFGGWAVLPRVDDASLSLRDAYPEAEKM